MQGRYRQAGRCCSSTAVLVCRPPPLLPFGMPRLPVLPAPPPPQPHLRHLGGLAAARLANHHQHLHDHAHMGWVQRGKEAGWDAGTWVWKAAMIRVRGLACMQSPSTSWVHGVTTQQWAKHVVGTTNCAARSPVPPTAPSSDEPWLLCSAPASEAADDQVVNARYKSGRQPTCKLACCVCPTPHPAPHLVPPHGLNELLLELEDGQALALLLDGARVLRVGRGGGAGREGGGGRGGGTGFR